MQDLAQPLHRIRPGRGRAAPFRGSGVEADPFFTADGLQLYFISSRADPPAKTGDDLDIWRVSRDRAGRWGAPQRLPAPINSAGAEWFPHLGVDGRPYFGSDRPGGRGQTDIYAVRSIRNGWQVDIVGGEVRATNMSSSRRATVGSRC